MSHYFINDPDLVSNKKQIEYHFNNGLFCFVTDNGVFSKNEVDRGSNALISSVSDLDLGNSILDLGCGYGVIGIVMKKINPNADVDLVDINDRAVELSKINAKLNNVKVNIYNSEDITKLNKKYDSILLNPPIRAGKKVIYQLYRSSYDVLNKNGKLYIVIQKKHGSESSLKELKSLFKAVKIVSRKSGYQIIESIK